MRVILAENDLVIRSFEYVKQADPVPSFLLEVNGCLQAERPHERVPDSQQHRNPCGLVGKDVSCQRLYVVACSFWQIHGERVREIGPAVRRTQLRGRRQIRLFDLIAVHVRSPIGARGPGHKSSATLPSATCAAPNIYRESSVGGNSTAATISPASPIRPLRLGGHQAPYRLFSTAMPAKDQQYGSFQLTRHRRRYPRDFWR